MIFEIEYRVEGYSLADCMRPNPFWGKRIFRVDSEKVQSEDIEALRGAAIATPPERYRFFSIQALPGGPKLFAPTATEQKE